MSRVHRLAVAVSAALWVLSLTLMFAPFAGLSSSLEAFLRVASINAGAMAACVTTVSVLPWLLHDYLGAFLAGWAKAQEEEPDEPATVTPIRLLG